MLVAHRALLAEVGEAVWMQRLWLKWDLKTWLLWTLDLDGSSCQFEGIRTPRPPLLGSVLRTYTNALTTLSAWPLGPLRKPFRAAMIRPLLPLEIL